MKSFNNNNKKVNFYYYRDLDQKEIDLIILDERTFHFIECKSGVSYSLSDVNSFNTLKKKTNYQVGKSCIICNTPKVYVLDDDIFVLPISTI